MSFEELCKPPAMFGENRSAYGHPPWRSAGTEIGDQNPTKDPMPSGGLAAKLTFWAEAAVRRRAESARLAVAKIEKSRQDPMSSGR